MEKNISKINFSVILYSVFVLFYSIGGLLEINWIVTMLNMDNRAFLVIYLVIFLFWGVGNIILLIISLFKNKKDRLKKVILITWNILLVTFILFLLVVTYLFRSGGQWIGG